MEWALTHSPVRELGEIILLGIAEKFRKTEEEGLISLVKQRI